MSTTLFAKAQASSVAKNELILTLIGVGLLACTAQITIPIQPVPITLQTVAVLLIGLFFPKHTAIKAILGYIGFGALGFPVFAEFHSGLHCLFFKPSAGYIWGFLAAIMAMTYFREKVTKDTFTSQFLNCCLGSFMIYFFGISVLSLSIGLPNAIKFGLLPFIIPGVVKTVLLSYTAKYAKSGRWI